MRTIAASALCGLLNAVEVAHVLSSEIPTLYINHVESQSFCELQNYYQFYAPGEQVFVFDSDLCACVFDEDLVRESKLFPTSIRQNNIADEDCFPNPLVPGECYLQCQIDALYDHNLTDCVATLDEVDYDYRTIPSRHRRQFQHLHSGANPGNSALFDDNGHLGNIEGCAGNVLHRSSAGVVYDEFIPRRDLQFNFSDSEDSEESEASDSEVEEMSESSDSAAEEMTNNASDQDKEETGTGLGGEVDIVIESDEGSDDEPSLPVDSESIQDAESAGEEETVSSDSDDEAAPAATLPSWLQSLISTMDDESAETENSDTGDASDADVSDTEVSDAEVSETEVDPSSGAESSDDEIDIPIDADDSTDEEQKGRQNTSSVSDLNEEEMTASQSDDTSATIDETSENNNNSSDDVAEEISRIPVWLRNLFSV